MQTMPLLLATVATLQAHPVRPAAPVPLAAPALAQMDPGMAAPPELLLRQDPGDSLYRAARQALNRNDYRRAAELFRQLRARFPASTHTPDAYYWEAFALYRTGADEALRAARTALQEQAQRHRDAATYRDAEVLLRRVQGELARRGDAEAAARIAEEAAQAAARPEDGAQPARPARPPRPPRPGRPAECDDEDDIRLAALNALLQMDEERAVPILQTVLAKRDEGSICLRRKAVFLLSQKRTGETEDILLDAARRDPDLEVRRQAVFWLSQVGTDKAAAALDSILRHATDAELQEKAVFALSQHRSPRAAAALRGYAERRDVPPRIREQAIFWLSQHPAPENAAFLRTLFARLESEALKEKVLFSVSQMRGDENARWLLDVALDRGQPLEIRKKALFWAGQSGQLPIADLVRLYDRTDDREMREQLVFVYSQRREPQAVDKLLEIAKGDPDRDLRKKALFWLGQSRDPRVAELLLQIINQPEP